MSTNVHIEGDHLIAAKIVIYGSNVSYILKIP